MEITDVTTDVPVECGRATAGCAVAIDFGFGVEIAGKDESSLVERDGGAVYTLLQSETEVVRPVESGRSFS